MPIHPKGIRYTAFKGLNNTGSPENTAPDYLKKVLNIDIDKTGNINKRKGYTKVDTANYSSLWSSDSGLGCYGIRDGNLVRINSDYSHTTIKSGLGNISLSFEEINGDIYIMSPTFKSIIRNGVLYDWGIEKNILAPTLSRVVGNLPEGTYQVSFTYVDSFGFEGGTVAASVITVPANSGISLSVPTPINSSNMNYCRIYCSNTNGNGLYYYGVADFNTTKIISDTTPLVNPLKTFNLDSAPYGTSIHYYKSRMYVIDGRYLWYSNPFQYNYFQLDSNYLEFDEDIIGVMVVNNGLWVCTKTNLYYLAGSDPVSMILDWKDKVSMIPGTATILSGSYTQTIPLAPGFKWLISTNLGIYLLADQGSFMNVSTPNVELESADSGTSLFLQANGMNQYLSILKTNQDPNNSIMGDLVETTITRNGITIS